MSSAAVAAAVRARLEANWSATPIVADTWLRDDEAPPPAGTAVWLAPDFDVPAEEEQITIGAPGDNVFREAGIFQLHLFGLAGNGATRLRQLADQLRTLFRAQTFAGVRCYGADPPEIGPGGGRWIRATVAVEYEHDLHA